MNLERTLNNIRFITSMWEDMGIPYSVKHGTYTTILESEMGKHRFMINSYSNKVFIARNKVLKDLKDSELAKEIMQGDYSTTNYGVNDNLKSMNELNVLNIDISSAYPHAIYNAGLISEETFNYLKGLKKKEKLPCLGMLAASHLRMNFNGGKVVDYHVHREPTSQIFFSLIQEVNDVMEECKWILGDNYIFHWVDGVFFKKSTSVKKINQVEQILESYKFPYKYEAVKKFNIVKNGDNYVISMNKNGEDKRYEFNHRNEHQRIKRHLTQRAKGQVHQV